MKLMCEQCREKGFRPDLHVRWDEVDWDSRKKIPVWVCDRCNSYVDDLTPAAAKRFKDLYFKSPTKPRGARGRFLENYKYSKWLSHINDVARKKSLEYYYEGAGYDICGSDNTMDGALCKIKVVRGRRCKYHGDKNSKQLNLF